MSTQVSTQVSGTQIRGQQIRLATISRGHVDAAFEAFLAQLQSDVTTIYSTMSTDQEQLDAISAITEAWQTADADLQAAITSMVNAAKAGVGLEPDGTFVLPDGQNFLTGATTVKDAIGKLDSALKAEQDARIADVTQLNSDMAALAAASAGTAAADLAASVATLEVADAANAAAIAQEVTDRIAAVAAEQTAREAAVADLDARLSAVEVGAMTFSHYVNRETPVGLVDGSNVVFQLAFALIWGTENVFLNGVLLEPGRGNDYTIDGQGEITLAVAPLAGDRVKVTYFWYIGT